MYVTPLVHQGNTQGVTFQGIWAARTPATVAGSGVWYYWRTCEYCLLAGTVRVWVNATAGSALFVKGGW
jgi:hypothetical protein